MQTLTQTITHKYLLMLLAEIRIIFYENCFITTLTIYRSELLKKMMHLLEVMLKDNSLSSESLYPELVINDLSVLPSSVSFNIQWQLPVVDTHKMS